MVYGCGNQLVKFSVFLVNLLIFVFGGLVFGFSLWASLDEKFADNLSSLLKQANISVSYEQLQQYQASLWVLVALGALLFFVGFLGCCGAACESLVFLTLYFIVLCVLFILELFTLVYLIVNKAGFLSALYFGLQKSAELPAGRENLKPIEVALNCCGATSETAHLYTAQCAAIQRVGVPDCYSVIAEKLDSMGDVIETVSIVLLVVQGFALVFACVLCRAFRERYPAYYA